MANFDSRSIIKRKPMNQLRELYSSNYSFISIVILFFAIPVGVVLGQQISNEQKEQLNSKTTDIIISEICNVGNKNYNFIELYNPTDSPINLSTGNYYLSRDNIFSISDVPLTGTIDAHGCYVCSVPYSSFIIQWKWFLWEYGINPDQQNNNWAINTTTSFILYKGGDSNTGTLLDVYGKAGEESVDKDWDYTNAHAVRKRSIVNPNSIWNPDEWVIVTGGSNQMSPGQHAADVQYLNTSGSWNTRGNWSAMAYVPDASCNVEIQSNQNLSIESSSACNQLTINESAQLSISAGRDLQVVESLNNLEGPQGLILNSDASGSSSLLHHANGVAATVKSYFHDIGIGEWYLISSPLSDAQAGIYMDQYLDYWDEPNAQWMDILGEDTPLVPGQGYSLQKELSNLASYSGTLNNGDITINNLTRSSGDYAGWNLVGNPYPSVVDIDSLDFGAHIIAAASVWPHGSNGTYLNWSQGSGGDIEARYIQPGQGFMIQLQSTDQSLTFTNAARTHHNLGSFDKGSSTQLNPNTLILSLTDQEGRIDHSYLSINNEATRDFDQYFDVHKLFGSANYPQIYSFIDIHNDEKAAIQGMPFPEEGDTIHLGYQIGESGNYTLSIKGICQFEINQNFYLIDHISQETYNLRQDSVFSVFLNVNDSQNRFDLLFDLSNSIDTENQQNCKVFFIEDQLIIDQAPREEHFEELVIYNLLGQAVGAYHLNKDDQIISVDLPSSYYVVQLRRQDKYLNKKIFKK